MYCIMPIHQEKKWDPWELPRLLFGESELQEEEEFVPLMERGTLWRCTFCPLFFVLFFFFFSTYLVASRVLHLSLLSHLGREGGARRLLFLSSLLYVCAIVVYPRASEYHQAV